MVSLSGEKESDLTWKHGEEQKGRRKQLLPGEVEVWENRFYINRERDFSKRAEFLPTECNSTQLAFIFPFSTKTIKQVHQHKFYLWWTQETWNCKHKVGRSKDQQQRDIQLLHQKEQGRYFLRWPHQEVQIRNPLFWTVEIGCKMLSAWASLDPILFQGTDEDALNKEPHRYVMCAESSLSIWQGRREIWYCKELYNCWSS